MRNPARCAGDDRLELANDPRYVEYRAAVLSFLYEKQVHDERIAA